MDATGKAVFLSYASQDAEAAKKICDALRAAGVEVWFDRSELRGGDAWDQKIRRQIKECTLFVPLITPNTNARPEGYFRLEWKLAVDRSHLMADDQPFLFPIVVGDLADATARVPDRFREVQWTRLRLDETPAELGARVAKLLSGSALEARGSRPVERSEGTASPQKAVHSRWQWWMIFPIAGTVMGLLFAAAPMWKAFNRAPRIPPAAATAPAPQSPAPKPSEARELADRAFALSVDKYDSSLDDFKLAESLMQKALALEANDGEILARAAQLNLMFRNRGFDFAPERVARGREQAERAIRLAPDSAEAVYALSLSQRYTGNPAAALESLERVILLDPNHARALLMLGSARISRGKTEEGFALYARARQQPQWAPLADYYEFLRQFGRRNFAEADRLIRSSCQAGASANSAAGVALVRLTWDGDFEAAAKELAAAPIKLLNAPRVVCVTALVHLARRRPEEALRVLDRLPDEFIQDAWCTGPKAALVGRSHAMAGREAAARIAWTEGLAVVEARLKASPGDAAIHHSRGLLLAWLGRTEEALEEARLVQELSRGGLPNWNLSAATIHAALGRADLALPEMEKMMDDRAENWNWPLSVALLRHDPLWDRIRDDVRFQRLIIEHSPRRDWPADPELKRAVGLLDGLDMIPEDIRLAEQIVQQVLDRNPTNAEAVTAMARVHSVWLLRGWDRSTARYQKAKATAERALQLAPDEPEAHAALAIHLYARGAEPRRAVDLAQRAVDLCPQEPRFHRMRDNCLWVLHVPAGSVFSDKTVEAENEGVRLALASARRTVELFPRDPLVRYELSRHYRDIGRWAEFEQVNDEVLALAPVANAMVWKARARFGLHGDLPGMKAVLDRVPARVRGIERTVFAYFLYAAATGQTEVGLEALNSMTEAWMIDFDYRGPKALLIAALLEQAGKKELARIQYAAALEELQRSRSLNPEDSQTFLVEAWAKHALGRAEEARAALRVFNESLPRPYLISPIATWWFQAIAANLLIGEKETALTLMREAVAGAPLGRATIRSRLAGDPRMASFRDDPAIRAILAEPVETK